jgi:hypothetical protein
MAENEKSSRTDEGKREGTARGEQFVRQPSFVVKKTAQFR